MHNARFWVTGLFILSGALGLVDEVLWTRGLGTIMGTSAAAQAVVLATFLAGLALGNAWLGARADRTSARLRLYASLELGVGLLAALSPMSFWLADGIYVGVARALGLYGGGLLLLRLGLAVAVVLPPATLMGGSLPALARWWTETLTEARAAIASLYAWNALGGVLGALLGAYVLLPGFGLDLSLVVSGGASAALGLAARWLARQPDAPRACQEAHALDPEPACTAQQISFIEGAVLVTGFVAIAYEIAWTRLLAIVLGSSTYSFAVMLAGFLLGIATGAALVARRPLNRLDALTGFAFAQVGAACAVLLTLPLYELVPYAFLRLGDAMPRTLSGFYLLELGKLAACLAVMWAPATFVGMGLPFASRCALRTVDELGARVGRIFALNTLGNVAAASAGPFLLPALGIRGLIEAGAVGNLLVGVAACLLLTRVRLSRRIAAAVALLFTVSTGLKLAPDWNQASFNTGAFEGHPLLGRGFSDYLQTLEAITPLYAKDDADTTVSVTQEGSELVLRVNGKVDATAKADRLSQILVGQLPCLLRPGARDALLVGLGSGMTAGSLLTHPLRHLDVVELSQGVKEAAGAFDDANHHVLADPRLEVVQEDGFGRLAILDKQYDIIVNEPSNPWIAGASKLFTREFFARAKQRLAPGGVMVQWFQAYAMDDGTLAMGVRTFQSVFPHVTVWQGLDHDLILVGSAAPLVPDTDALDAAFAQPKVRADLEREGIGHVATLLSAQILPEDLTAKLAGEGPLNRLDAPHLEFAAPIALFMGKPADAFLNLDPRRGWAGGWVPGTVLARYVASRKQPLSAQEWSELAAFQATAANNPEVASAAVAAWNLALPTDNRAHWAQVRMLLETHHEQQARESAARIVDAHAGDVGALYQAAQLELLSVQREKQPAGLERLKGYLNALGKARPALRPWACIELAHADVACDRLTEAAAALDEATRYSKQADEETCTTWLQVAQAAYHKGDAELAKRCTGTLLVLDPTSPGARTLGQKLGLTLPPLTPPG